MTTPLGIAAPTVTLEDPLSLADVFDDLAAWVDDVVAGRRASRALVGGQSGGGPWVAQDMLSDAAEQVVTKVGDDVVDSYYLTDEIEMDFAVILLRELLVDFDPGKPEKRAETEEVMDVLAEVVGRVDESVATKLQQGVLTMTDEQAQAPGYLLRELSDQLRSIVPTAADYASYCLTLQERLERRMRPQLAAAHGIDTYSAVGATERSASLAWVETAAAIKGEPWQTGPRLRALTTLLPQLEEDTAPAVLAVLSSLQDHDPEVAAAARKAVPYLTLALDEVPPVFTVAREVFLRRAATEAGSVAVASAKPVSITAATKAHVAGTGVPEIVDRTRRMMAAGDGRAR